MRAYITNVITSKKYQVEKDSLEELNNFIQYQKDKKKCPWGSVERELVVSPDEHPARALFVENIITQEPVFDENFELVFEDELYTDEDGVEQTRQVQVFETVTKHKVTIPQEFEISIDETPEENTPEHQAEIKRVLVEKRDKILVATDWLFLSDVNFDQKHRGMYMVYRQYLRELPQKIKPNVVTVMETFEAYARRNNPEEFMDGGNGQKIIDRFMYYVKG